MHQYAVQNRDRVKHKEPIKGWTSEKMPRTDSSERRSKLSADCCQNLSLSDNVSTVMEPLV